MEKTEFTLRIGKLAGIEFDNWYQANDWCRKNDNQRAEELVCLLHATATQEREYFRLKEKFTSAEMADELSVLKAALMRCAANPTGYDATLRVLAKVGAKNQTREKEFSKLEKELLENRHNMRIISWIVDDFLIHNRMEA